MFEKIFDLRIETIVTLVILVVLSAILFFVMKKGKSKFTTKIIVYAGITIALAFVLSSIRLFKMPQGGTITPASMLPLFIFSFMFGPIPGIVVGALYGFLQLLQDAFVVHWAQLLLDYPLAFASIGLAGFFRKRVVIGILIGSFVRMAFHVLSGFIFFKEYAPEGQYPLIYSFFYNGSFMSVETVIVIALAIPVLASLKRSNSLKLTP